MTSSKPKLAIAPASKTIKAVYTDGSGNSNSPCGWAVVVVYADGSTHELGGFEADSTNQRAELLGITNALEFLSQHPQSQPVQLFTDSEYCVNGINQHWVAGWVHRGWQNAQGQPVKNQDLWERLEALRSVNASVHHLRGHSDRGGKDGANRRAENATRYGADAAHHNQGNCRADAIAAWCRKNQQPIEREGQRLVDKWSEPTQPIPSSIGFDYVLEEFRNSAIPDNLTEANVFWVEGNQAIQILAEQAIAECQRVQSYATVPARRILDRYAFAAVGGWVSYGCDMEGGRGQVACFKPASPRKILDDGKFKTVKYETPAKCEALPILPCVDEQTAQEIYRRHNVTPLEGEGFWQVVQRCNLPVAIAEGLKKALALIAHAVPAIAIRGITQWHKKGGLELHEAIAQFATPGRWVYIVFDQDKKPKTQRDVRIQALKLASALESRKCKVNLPVWDGALGKGIDDVLHKQGSDALTWLCGLLGVAPSLKAYRRSGAASAALGTIDRLNTLSFLPERETTGEYMPELPPLEQGFIHVVLAAMNSGKTTRLSHDWVNQDIQGAIARGWNVLILTPLNSLGRQTAKDLGLPHIHDFGTSAEQQEALWATVSASHGLVMCPDSIPRLLEQDWFLNRPLLLGLDEANQVIEHLTQGNTLGSRWSNVVEGFSAVASHAAQSGAIVLSEDGLPDRAVKFMQSISGCDRVRVFKHAKQGAKWNCSVFSGQASGFRARILEAAKSRDRILVTTSSQREARRLERALSKAAPNLKVVRIDSQTNQQGAFNDFFEEPDTWLHTNQPDVLIISPSAKSGVSIEGNVAAENAYFNAVYGYFPSLSTDTHAQLLGRYRPPVPRFVFVPQFILSSGDESFFSPRAVKRRLHQNTKALTSAYQLGELLEAEGDRAETLLVIENAVIEYLSEANTVSGARKSIAHDALVHRLEQAGHIVEQFTESKHKPTIELWNMVQEELWREDAALIASYTISSDHTPEWAYKTLDGLDTTLEQRTIAQKVLWREEFPGVMFDEPEECYQALCQDYGSMRRGVLLQASAENVEATKQGDRSAIESILGSKIRAIHRLPKKFVRALILQRIGILKLLDGQTYTNDDLRAMAVKKEALHFAKEISYWLRLQIKPEQTPVEICNKLLRKFGLKAVAIARPGKRNEQRSEIWSIDDLQNPVRVRLLEAARRKLSELVSPICNRDKDPHIQIGDTSEANPQSIDRWGVGDVVRWGSSLGSWRIESLDDSIAHLRLISSNGYSTFIQKPVFELREVLAG